MRVKLNDGEVIIPSSLSEITVGQRIKFYEQYGRQLDEMLESIQQMKDEQFKELELVQWHNEMMYRTFAFFAGVSVESLKSSAFTDDVARIYYSCLSVIMDEEQELELQREFTWKNEEWEIQSPVLTQKHKMKFEELIDSKQIVKDMIELGRGKWEYMIRLCAIYLRKKGEAYSDEFVQEDSERLKLMEELPLSIAVHVGFFLSSSLNIAINTSPFFKSPGQRAVATSLSDTSSSTVG